MSASSPRAILADTSYPNAAQTRAEQAPRNWMNVEIFWAEDALLAWRGLAVFGGLLFITGMVYWLAATGYSGWTMGPFIGLIGICFLASAFVAFLGLTEATLALLGTAGVAAALAIFDPPSLLPSAGALFTDPSALAPDLDTVLALSVAGVILLLVGVAQSVRTARELDDDV